jgi:hypothetical protein
MRKVLVLLAVTVGAAAALAVWLGLRGGASEPPALPQDAMPGRLLVGFQDDPSLRWGADRQAMLDRAREAGTTVIRTIVD